MSEQSNQAELQHVLLAEDDAVFRATLAEFMENLGYRVTTASNAPDALKLYRDLRGELVMMVTDICMPEPEDGIELIRNVRDDNPHLPIVVATGYDQYQAVDASDRLQTMIFDKPFDFVQFHRYLDEIKT